jgi:hypothetical protein
MSICLLACFTSAAQASVSADLRKKINGAVDKGVEYLKKLQAEDGSFRFRGVPGKNDTDNSGNIGATALAGLALLECGVKPEDKAVQKAADYVREGSVKLDFTYSIALAIMFLDRLDDPGDVPLIESLTVRLLAGQNLKGGWSYTCPAISEAEVRRLTTHLQERSELVRKGKLPKSAGRKKRTVRDLPREIQDQLVQLDRLRVGDGGRQPFKARWQDPGPVDGDNSNTQFALLALWIGRRMGLPVHTALRRTEQRFRASQLASGGWGYWVPNAASGEGKLYGATGAMTCAGLLSLAAGHGAVNEQLKEKDPKARSPRNPDKDLAIKRGFIALGTTIGQLEIDTKERTAVFGRDPIYYLWSLERVAMAYGLETIAKKDWYAWGAEFLVANQSADGAWKGTYTHGGVETSFALLFLVRSNLVPDLTTYLKGTIRNAGETSLKAGGVGGSQLKGIQPGIGPDIKDSGRRDDPAAKKTKPAVSPQATGEQDKAIARLSAELVRASGDEQERVLDKLRAGKGVIYTEALAGSIPLLKGTIRDKARAALAQRLTRMTAATLRDKLKDDNLEIRRAAALACAAKKSKAHIPDLIEALGDVELPVALAALQALKDLTGQDFGPAADATRAERKTAIARWQAWWKKEK